jgi:hypothetical protein
MKLGKGFVPVIGGAKVLYVASAFRYAFCPTLSLCYILLGDLATPYVITSTLLLSITSLFNILLC